MKELNSILFKFLWDTKRDKLKRTQVTGLKMINIEHFINSLQITWIRRLELSENSPIKNLNETTITPVNNLFVLRYQYIETKLKMIPNKFWHDTLSSWIYMCK